MVTGNTDLQLLLSLNSLAGANGHLLVTNALVRGVPVFVPLVALWFASDCTRRRSRMLVGLLATCLATVLSVWLQHHFTPHIRPLLDPSLHLKIIDPKWTTIFWDRKGSFPSDTATLYFALAAVVFIENRLIGCFCFLWVLMAIGFSRVIFGWHYPSDIIGSMVLGAGCVFLLNKIPYIRTLFESALKLFETRTYIVHAFLFAFLADAFNLFGSLQQISALALSALKNITHS